MNGDRLLGRGTPDDTWSRKIAILSHNNQQSQHHQQQQNHLEQQAQHRQQSQKQEASTTPVLSGMPTSSVQQGSHTTSPRSRARNGAEWECVEVLRGGPNPRWRCKSCLTEYTGAPRRIAQHILGAGGVGQIKACPCPQPEFVSLMTDLMALDSESGRLVKKTRFGEDGGGSLAGAGALGSPSSAKCPRKSKPRAVQQASPETFEVFVGKEDFKFSSSHFVAFEGFRERLHGHNYHVSVRVKGQLCDDGYVIDFGVIKQKTRKLCKELNERFLCPVESDALKITVTSSQVVIVCQDGATFVMPRDDCALLPIMHSTAEELAHYLFFRLLREITLEGLHARGITEIEIAVSEAPRQEARYCAKVPLTEDQIREPPFRNFRRVEGCSVRDGDDSSYTLKTSLNNGGGNSSGGGSGLRGGGAGPGGAVEVSDGIGGGTAGGRSSSSSPPPPCPPSSSANASASSMSHLSQHAHAQAQAQGSCSYPSYGTLIGVDSTWGGGAGNGGNPGAIGVGSSGSLAPAGRRGAILRPGANLSSRGGGGGGGGGAGSGAGAAGGGGGGLMGSGSPIDVPSGGVIPHLSGLRGNVDASLDGSGMQGGGVGSGQQVVGGVGGSGNGGGGSALGVGDTQLSLQEERGM